MDFAKAVLFCYWRPKKAFELVKAQSLPCWGLYGTLLRALIISSVNYLPKYLMRSQPSPQPYLTFIQPQHYYGFLIWFSPIFFILEWLLLGAIFHVFLRIFKAHSDIDKILNINGVIDLAAQPIITLADVLVMVFATTLPFMMGSLHLVIVTVFVMYLSAIAYKKVLDLPYWVGASFVILASFIHAPIAILFLRP